MPPPGPSSADLVGRSADLAVLDAFVAGAAVHGGALLLSGDPGIGKTVLLDHAQAVATAAGCRVLRAAGVEVLTDLGFSTLGALLQPVSPRIDELDDGHRRALESMLGLGAAPAPDQILGYNAVLSLLGLVAAERPLLVIVDDVHWADRATAVLLGFVARRLADTRIGLLASCRSGYDSMFVRTGLPQHDLAPLADRDAATLLATRHPLLGPRATRRVLAEAQGNPLALLELPVALTETAHPESAPMASSVLPLSRRLHALYSGRVEELPRATRRLLLLAALEGTGDLRTVTAAAGSGDLSDLAPAERQELITVDPELGRLGFRHPVIRSTVVGVATVGERLAAHAALAEALRNDAVRHARHRADASSGPDEDVADLLVRSAHLVMRRGDAVGAFTSLLRAADLSPEAGPRSRRLAEAAYIGAHVTGELRVAAQLLVEARRADPAVRGSLRAAAAAAYLLMDGTGDIRTAHRLLVGALELAPTAAGEDEEAWVEALQMLFRVSCYGAHPGLWRALFEMASRFPGELPPMLHLSLQVLGHPAGVSEAELRAAESAIEALRDESDPTRIERVTLIALFLDRAADCREALWRVVEDGRAGGAVASSVTALMILGIDAFHAGQWTECAAVAAEGLALCDAQGYELLRWPFAYCRAMLAAARGDQDTVDDLVRRMEDWAAPRGASSVSLLACHAAALAALGRGDAEQAYAQAARVSLPGEMSVGVPQALWIVLDLIEAAAASGRRAEAAAHAAALQEAGLTAFAPRLALLTAGGAAIAAAGDDGAATELFERALALPGAERWPFDTARVHLHYGEHLHRHHAEAPAREHLSVAMATFRRLRATPWEARAGLALRAAGATAGRAPVAVPLSETELRIAGLAAGGLTNKQIGERLFLSHRTVGAHLRQIFPKLGITSRAALRDALAALDGDGARPPAEPRGGHLTDAGARPDD